MAGSTPLDEDDVVATRLGGLARSVDGSVTPDADAAARERMRRALQSRSGSRVPKWTLGAAAAAMAAAAVLLFQSPAPETVVGYQMSGGSIRIADDWVQVPADHEPGVLAFTEGTRITLAPGSETRVAHSDANGARVVLRAGRLRARVVHLPQTRWVIAAGPYEVHVVGTELSVEWRQAEERLEVQLHEGRVVVRGPSLSEGIAVAIGQRLVAHAQTGNAELSSMTEVKADSDVTPTPSQEAAVVAKTSPPEASSTSVVSAANWSELITQGEFRAVLARAQERGVETTLKKAGLSDLVAFTDAARYSGDNDLSRRGLMAQRVRFASRPEAKAAAFLLGRLADDEGSAREALRWYDVYLKQAPRGAFAAEALGRKLVALVRSGDVPKAQAVAEEYLRRFADGAHADYAREVLQQR